MPYKRNTPLGRGFCMDCTRRTDDTYRCAGCAAVIVAANQRAWDDHEHGRARPERPLRKERDEEWY